jgi:eukaryotic-like serine/threonine-protein kinase
LNETVAGDRYRVGRTLGEGAMAVVYLAHDEELRRPVAIKVLGAEVAADEELRARFLREARLASRLAHPNVVRVYDASEAGGRLFIVMEYVPGSTLADYSKLAHAEAIGLVRQACAGVQHAHDAGLVHRDIKPANLLLRDDGVLKIADFGIARAADTTQLTQQGTVLGTAAYLAPEQAAGETVGPAADIYSLAAVLYELLTGRPPYQPGSLAELGDLQRAGAITPPRDLEPSVPQGVEAALMRALAREPRFRPSSAAEFGRDLAGVPEEAPTRPRRSHRETSRTKKWTVGVVLGVVAVAGAVIAIARTGDSKTASRPPKPAPISSPVRGATPAAEARNLSAWLRAHSRAH